MVAKRKDYLVAIPMQIGIDYGSPWKLALQNLLFLGNLLPILENDKPRARTRIPSEILVHHVQIPRIGQPALDYEQFIELKIGMKEKNPPSQRTDFAFDSFSELGILLPREPLRVELEFLAIRFYRFCIYHFLAKPLRQNNYLHVRQAPLNY